MLSKREIDSLIKMTGQTREQVLEDCKNYKPGAFAWGLVVLLGFLLWWFI